MDASCFFGSKSITKTLDLVHPLKSRLNLKGSSSFDARRRRGCGGAKSPSICRSMMSYDSPMEDNENLRINSDWRTFRARLVFNEQQSPTSLSFFQGNRWAHPIHTLEKGCLLVASEKLNGVHIFERTVILVLSTGPRGPTGIILNKPSLMSIKDSRSIRLDNLGTFSDLPLFFGGPTQEGVFLVGNQHVGKSEVLEEVVDGVWCGGRESVGCAAEMVRRGVVGVEEFGFFEGKCGWERGQLEEEIEGGCWNMVACGGGVIGVGRVGLWDEVMGLVGQKKVW